MYKRQDGDHFIYWGSIFSQFNTYFNQSDQLMTISVKGPQSSGKSTLVNLKYGADFKSGSGKCTSGINGYIMRVEDNYDDFEKKMISNSSDNFKSKKKLKVTNSFNSSVNSDLSSDDNEISEYQKPKKKYLFFLDSQGMLSEELRNKDFDRKIGTFSVSYTHLTLPTTPYV